MKQVQQLRDSNLLKKLSKKLNALELSKPISLMEVCGTHTMAIHRAGLPGILPEGLRLISGPGCPVCVTPSSYLDNAMTIARTHDVTLATFGDMMRVPGTLGTLTDLRHEGYPVEIVYSPLGAVEMAQQNPGNNIIFLAVGFETTVPTIAASILQARQDNINNFSVLTAHKLVIPALEALISDPSLKIDGFILPGHVSVILGCEPYNFISEKHDRACVITGFEAADIIQGILMLVKQIEEKNYKVEIQYQRAVQPKGNPRARALMDEVFQSADAIWRGFGNIPKSALMLRDNFADFNAHLLYPVKVKESPEPAGCRCGDVLRGHITPPQCALFGETCTPDNPIGPCMVSTEGTCSAYYQNERKHTLTGKGEKI